MTHPVLGLARALGVALVIGLVPLPAVSAADDRPPVIVQVVAPARLTVGIQTLVRLRYRAPQANVIALVVVADDLDAAGQVVGSRQRELNVLARAFGIDEGELVVPISFATPGPKRVTLTLLTDERLESEPEAIELVAVP